LVLITIIVGTVSNKMTKLTAFEARTLPLGFGLAWRLDKLRLTLII
jgi:hypothetical protein